MKIYNIIRSTKMYRLFKKKIEKLIGYSILIVESNLCFDIYHEYIFIYIFHTSTLNEYSLPLCRTDSLI